MQRPLAATSCSEARAIVADSTAGRLERQDASTYMVDNGCFDPASESALEFLVMNDPDPMLARDVACRLARFKDSGSFVLSKLQGNISGEQRVRLSFCVTSSADPATMKAIDILSKDDLAPVRSRIYPELGFIGTAKTKKMARGRLAVETDPVLRKQLTDMLSEWKSPLKEPPFGPFHSTHVATAEGSQ